MSFKRNVVGTIRKMAVKELKDYIYEDFYNRIRFHKEKSYYLMKYQKKQDLLFLATTFIEKITDASTDNSLHIRGVLITLYAD